MQHLSLGSIDKFVVHFIGNKNDGDGVRLSEEITDFAMIEEKLTHLLINNLKTEELYQFFFEPTLDLNPMYQFVGKLFDDDNSFISQTKNLGKYLYEKSTHPNIKSGELCIAHIKNCTVEHDQVDCIAIFKSESKDTILKIDATSKGYKLTDVTGLNVNKIDKGCFVFNNERESGFKVCIVDNTNKATEARYWRDDFLSVCKRKDDYRQTDQFLGIAKQFVTKQLAEEFEVTKTDQIDLLNKSVGYFKNRDTFDKAEFEAEVFGDNDVIDSFRKFDQGYRQDNEIDVSDNFDISEYAVKKQSRVFKSVLKLDKNFDIYIHGDKNLIEKGVEKDGRKYYKIYYNEEL